MPVRLLNSSVIKWPDENQVLSSLQKWIEVILPMNKEILQIGYFGSYARGDWGVGSDLDIVIILRQSNLPFGKRNQVWEEHILPVPTDVLIYTQEEWEKMRVEESLFFSRMNREIKWVYSMKTVNCECEP